MIKVIKISGWISAIFLFVEGINRIFNHEAFLLKSVYNYYIISICINIAILYLLIKTTSFYRYILIEDIGYMGLSVLFILSICVIGPFFQPPSDPIFHSDLLWDSLGDNIFNLANRELISKALFYSLNSLLEPTDLSGNVLLIHLLHSYFSILMTQISNQKTTNLLSVLEN